MSDSLKDQLMQLGFKPKVEPRRDERRPGKPPHARGGERSHDGRPEQRGAGRRAPDARVADGRRGGGDARKRAPRPAGQPGAGPAGARQPGAAQARAGKSGAEMDLARAYALRQRQEQAERAREEQARQEEARLRREARQKLAQLLDGKAQNQADADLARHFEFGGKIRRVHVTEPQFKAINAGELGVVQLAGRYLLVDAAVAREAAALLPASLALLVDPNATDGGDDYSDPRYVVPDDLVW